VKITFELGDTDLGAVMTWQQWIALVEEIITFWRNQHQPSPGAIRDLTVATNRSNSKMATLKWTDPTTDNQTPPQPLTPGDLVSINIYDTASAFPAVPLANVPATNGPNTYVTVNLAAGDHVFSAAAVDKNGNVGVPSDGAPWTEGGTSVAPAKITDLTVGP
jgi:protein involved in polysaccharide export with SLBB domain